MKTNVHFKIHHRPTLDMPDAKKCPYRLNCKCGNTIIASETRIPKWIIKKFKDVPCSKCVNPDAYLDSIS